MTTELHEVFAGPPLGAAPLCGLERLVSGLAFISLGFCSGVILTEKLVELGHLRKSLFESFAGDVAIPKGAQHLELFDEDVVEHLYRADDGLVEGFVSGSFSFSFGCVPCALELPLGNSSLEGDLTHVELVGTTPLSPTVEKLDNEAGDGDGGSGQNTDSPKEVFMSLIHSTEGRMALVSVLGAAIIPGVLVMLLMSRKS